MEKFGIFELLDALSAISPPISPPKEAGESTPRTDDAAFAPPSYAPATDALQTLLEKHDAASKRIGKKKGP